MVLLTRNLYDTEQTRGILVVLDDDFNTIRFRCHTLELPWLDNAKNISCIPHGTYRCTKHHSPTFGACIKVHDVTNRTDILVHSGNFHSDTKGCILVGKALTDLNGDGLLDVTSSRVALFELLDAVPHEFELTIEYTNY
jgi:hypothetical protein